MKKKSTGILFSLSVAGFIIASSNAHANTSGETNEPIHNIEQSVNKDDYIQQNISSTEDKNISSKDTTKTNNEPQNDTLNSEDNNQKNIEPAKENRQMNINSSDENQEQQEQNEQDITDQQTPDATNPEENLLTEKTQSKKQNEEISETPPKNTIDSHENIVSNHNPGNTEQEETSVTNENTNNTTKGKSADQSHNKFTEQQGPQNGSTKMDQSIKATNTETQKNEQPSNETPQPSQNISEKPVSESQQATQNQHSNEHRYPILTIGADNSEKNLTWYHESDEQGYVEIAEANKDGDFSNARRIKGQTHERSNTELFLNKDVPDMNYTQAALSNLEENKEYMYRFYNGDNREKSAIRRFDTNNNGETNFIAIADPQLGASGNLEEDNAVWQNTVNQMDQLNKDPDFLLSLGDQVNEPWDEKAYSGFIEAQGMENFTVVPILGNHDRANKAFSQHFNLPNLQDDGKNLASSNFYYTHNDTLFVSLNSESLDFKGHEETLRRAIEDTKSQDPKWIVGLTHRNPYSAGKHSDTLATKNRRNHIAPLMEKYNVDLVLGGHDHSYSRSHVMKGKEPQVQWDENGEAPKSYINPDGTVYVTLNSSSGSKFYELDGEKDYAAKSIQDNKPTFSKVNIKDSYIEVLTYHVPQGSEELGEPIDKVRINKS
ncbi:N-acetylmuramoyl-L-alanine amidase [Staphylococcus equorum]|uniref:purple acid phosphatase family protein n=1 Tax=Staphylococcus equorum TaxID=246432 RepID=UPI000E68DEB8|nr:metallophosphoesterase family protein [Staphylococcus equorum]RIL53317.1 N-acetylmuramoyl-L-alanine amidase [Staphylococcus equorum]